MVFKYDNTLSTFQVCTYFGLTGLILNTPFKNLETNGSLPISSFDIKDKAERWVFNVPYEAPL